MLYASESVYPKFKTCRKRKSKKRQWFPPQDGLQLVQVTSKKKQWFSPQDGAEVQEMEGVDIGVNMQEKVTHTIQLQFYAYETIAKRLTFQKKLTNEAEVQVEGASAS
jgi:hypothetical protein